MAFLAPLVAFFAANAPAIGAASALAGAGTSIGEAIANSGGAPKPGAPPPPTPPNAQAQQNLNARVGQQEPNVVGATSGLASPSYESLIAQILAGTFGQPGSTAAGNAATGFTTGTGQSLNQNFTPANSQPTNAAVQGQPINLSDFLSTST
jgi:hypothetical protein